MPKFVKPWFRASRGAWYVNLAGKQINLGPDHAAAFQEYARPDRGAPGRTAICDRVGDLKSFFIAVRVSRL